MNNILSISDLNIKDKLSVIYFYADWLPIHIKMIQALNFAECNSKGIYFYAVNVNWFLEICRQFKVDSIPKILIIKNNKTIKIISDLISGQDLLSIILDIYQEKIRRSDE